ncbi:hypothetical protein EGH25_06775 [Haladaptatus sp. F3-133]|uniref:Nucleic acid-binding protein, contains PIN domain n=1 Tax=Halorutilus salinus TaxID=2487751 RepID=A0A9Q4GIP9_9EURY|nr:hypothetical protein [Halorutilus salinus]MCX2819053.1 hypothetical protein [Halorutilus salinus]
MRVYVDATTIIALGSVGELQLLRNFDGEVTVPPAVRDEVTTEPARTNLVNFVDSDEVRTELTTSNGSLREAREVLNEDEENGDVQIVACVLEQEDVAVLSDDRRVRTVSEGFGATVTGTVGVVVRAVREGMSSEEAKDVVRRVDQHGLHMTAELREKAYELVEREDTN